MPRPPATHPLLSLPGPLRIGGAGSLLAAGLMLLAGCELPSQESGPLPPGIDDTSPPEQVERPTRGQDMGGFLCAASRVELAVRCAADDGSGAAPAPGLPRIIGGQGYMVELESSNVSYDEGAEEFTFDVLVANLMAHTIGASDDGEVTGIRVFFESGPTVTGGSGSISVLPDGVGTFTGAGQPFYEWNEELWGGAETELRTWTLGIPPSVDTFVFSVRVQADVIPVIVVSRAFGAGFPVELEELLTVEPALENPFFVDGTDGDAVNPSSARGKMYFALVDSGQPGIWVAEGFNFSRLTTGADRAPARNPTGNQLVFLRNVAGQERLFTADSLGGGATELLPSEGTEPLFGDPHFSSKGDLVYVRQEAGPPQLFLLEGGGGTPQDLDVEGVEPFWSPDGTRILFSGNPGMGGELSLLIHTVATGVTEVVYTPGGGLQATQPTWLQDGRVVFLVRDLGTLAETLYRATPGAWDELALLAEADGPDDRFQGIAEWVY